MTKKMTEKQLRRWMNYYHDRWIELHNKSIENIVGKQEEKVELEL